MESKKEVMHTPEPWFFEPTTGHKGRALISVGTRPVDEIDDDGIDSTICGIWGDSDTDYSNERRIVACVNACKGIGTETLERYHESHKPENGFGLHREAELIAQRDELLEALKGAISAWDGVYPHLKSDVHSQDYIEEIEWTQMQAARAAIAKCEVKS